MTAQDFSQRLTRRYPSLAKAEAQLEDIEVNLGRLDDSGRDRLWELFVDGYSFATAPTWASLHKIADGHLSISGRSGNRGAWMQRCTTCRTETSLEIPKCPKCGSRCTWESFQSKHLPEARQSEAPWAVSQTQRTTNQAILDQMDDLKKSMHTRSRT